MIPIFKRRLGRFGGSGNKGLPVVSIPHTKNGTFDITFRGTNGAIIYCDPGDGSAVQAKTLLGASTDVTFSYSNDGSYRVVRICGALDAVTTLDSDGTACAGNIKELAKFNSLASLRVLNNSWYGSIKELALPSLITYLSVSTNNLMGDFAEIAPYISATTLSLHHNNFTYSTAVWLPRIYGTYLFNDCLLSSSEVDQLLIDFAAANWANATINLAGNNAVRTNASDSALVTLLGNSCSVTVNE